MPALHDPNKVLLGTNLSSSRVLTSHAADPASFPAGLAVRRSAEDGLQLDDDDTASLIGISAGRDLSDTERTSVFRKGLKVPLRLKPYAASGTIEITAYDDAQGDSAVVAGVAFVGQSGSATPGTAFFQSTSNNAAATSLATQINAHDDTKNLVTAVAEDAVVTVTAKEPGLDGNEIVLSWIAESAAGGAVSGEGFLAGGSDGVAVQGETVYVNDDGLGCDSEDEDAAETNAVYSAGYGVLVGVDPIAKTEHYVGLVDMPGGL